MIRYTARFATRDGSFREVIISDALPSDGGTPVVLTLSAEGVRLETSTDEDPLTPLRPTTGVLPIVIEKGKDYSRLWSGAAYTLTVLITHDGLVDFQGYVSPEVLTAQWPPVGSVMQLGVVCPLEKIRGERLEVTTADFSTFRSLLWECLYPHGIAPLSSEYAVMWPMGQSVTTGATSGGSVLELKVARALFYEKDTDADGQEVTRGKPLSDILTEILRTLGLCLTIDGRTVRIFRPGQTLYRRTRIDHSELHAPSSTVTPSEPPPIPTDGWRYIGEAHTTSRYRGARRIEVVAQHSRWDTELFNIGSLNFSPVANEGIYLASTSTDDHATAIRAYHNVSTDGTLRTYSNRVPSEWVGTNGFIPDQGRFKIAPRSGRVEKGTTWTYNNVGGSFPGHAVRVYEGHPIPPYKDFTPAIVCVTNTFPAAGQPTQRDESQPLFRFRAPSPVVLSGGAIFLTASLGAVHTWDYTLLAPVTEGYGKLKAFLRIGEYVWRGVYWMKNATLADTVNNAVELPMAADNVDRGHATAPAGFEYAKGVVGARRVTTLGGGFIAGGHIAEKIHDDKAVYIPLELADSSGTTEYRRAIINPELRVGGHIELSLYFVSANPEKRGGLGAMLLTDVGLSYREHDTSWGFSGEPKTKPHRTLAHDTTTGQTGDTYELSLMMHSDHETARGAYSTLLHGTDTLRTWYDRGKQTTLEAARLRDAITHQDRVREYRDVMIEQDGTTPPYVGSLVTLDGRTWVVLSRSALFAEGAYRLQLLDIPKT